VTVPRTHKGYRLDRPEGNWWEGQVTDRWLRLAPRACPLVKCREAPSALSVGLKSAAIGPNTPGGTTLAQSSGGFQSSFFQGHFPAPATRAFRLATAVSRSDEGAGAVGSNETLSRSTAPRCTASDPQISHRPWASNSIQLSQFAHHHGSLFTGMLIAECHDL
jgi:hypothetical protein